MSKKIKKKWLIIIGIIVLLVACIGGYALYGNYQMSKIPRLSFQETLDYTLSDNQDAVITIGIIQDGEVTVKVYGKDSIELEKTAHIYEIGSLTKTITSAMVEKAVHEGKLDYNETIDAYLDLPTEKIYPTIQDCITHTSGYEGYYFESPMIGNFLNGKNDFLGITDEIIMNRLSKLSLKDKEYEFEYSNFGYAIMGIILETVYHQDYTELVNNFVHNELGLMNTKISEKDGDLNNYWDWKEGDAYLSAGGLTSTIDDMLIYAQYQLNRYPSFEIASSEFLTINESPESYQKMGIRMDAIDMGWIVDSELEVIWHNGGTDNYNCYLAFHPDSRTSVIVLSNLSPSTKIPSTVMGIKLMKELINNDETSY